MQPTNLTSAYGVRNYTPNQAIGGQNTTNVPFVIAGLKANQPGSLNSTNANTLKPSQTASPSNQSATGNTSSGTSYQGVSIPAGLNSAQVQAMIQAINKSKGISSTTPTSQNTSPNPAYQNTLNPTNTNTGQGPVATGNYTDINGNIINPAQSTANSVSAANNANPTPTMTGLIGQATNAAQGNLALGQQAQNIGNQYAGLINTAGQNAALAQNSLITGGGPSAPILGDALAQAQLGAARTQAYGTAEQAALQGVNTALTAQGQATQGLNTSAGLLSPSNTTIQVSPGSSAYQQGPNGLNQITNGQQSLANYNTQQQVSSLSSSYPDAKSAQGQPFVYDATQTPQQNAQNFMQNYLPNSPTYQKSTYGAPGATSTATGASVGANSTIYQTALENVANLQNSLSNVDDLGNLLISTATSGGINPTNSQTANLTIQQVQNQLSGPAQAQFNSTLAALQSKASGLLSIGGNEIPTAVTSQISSFLSGTLALSALPALMQQIQTEGNIVLNNQKQVASTAYGNLPGGGGNNTTSSAGSTSGVTSSGITYTITP